jgi:membrane fusion protein, multidrug efflux system
VVHETPAGDLHVRSHLRGLTALLLSGISLWISAQTLAGRQDQPTMKPATVIITEPRQESVSDRIEALGTLKASESVSITANVTEAISALHFDDGQRVHAGDLLVEMTSTEERALLDEAKVRANEAERQFRRIKSLVDQRSASESLLDERQRDLDTTRAVLVALESRLADRVIKAPFDGIVGLRHVSPGALVTPGDPITTLDDDRIMKLDFAVPSTHLAALIPGLKIEAKAPAFGDRVFTGVVRTIDSRIDPVTRAVQVRAILPNLDGTLRPGLLLQVTLLAAPRNAVLVPETAILHQGRGHAVMVVIDGKEGPVANRRPIEIGTRRPGWVEIRSGIRIGERVVTDGNDKLRAGQSLKVLAVDDGTQNRHTLLEQSR